MAQNLRKIYIYAQAYKYCIKAKAKRHIEQSGLVIAQ